MSVGYYADQSRPEQNYRPVFINTADNAWAHYTYADSKLANHSVTIIGYNDRFPKSYFIEGHQPPKDGAWLVKNSWGGGKSTVTNFSSWGIDENHKLNYRKKSPPRTSMRRALTSFSKQQKIELPAMRISV